jgi:uncharacterized phage-like protein YoqJ
MMHRELKVNKIKVYPLIEIDEKKGTKFKDVAGTEVSILSCENRTTGNLTMPYYTVKTEGKVFEDMSQEYLVQFTGITTKNRKIADVWIGNDDWFLSHWTVSLSSDKSFMYCVSPQSSNDYKYTRILDQFDRNVVTALESAVTRLVLGFLGAKFRSKYLNNQKVYKDKSSSCEGCVASRKIYEEDSGQSTQSMRDNGAYETNIVCAYTMQKIDQDRVNALNKESVTGANKSGHISSHSELYRAVALDCNKYHSFKSSFIRINSNEAKVVDDVATITTMGFKLIFKIGTIAWSLPSRENLSSLKDLPEKIACVTGHRPEKVGGYDENNITAYYCKRELYKEVETLIKKGYNYFISGMALAVDTWFAETVLALKHKYPHIKLEAAIPCTDHTKKWSWNENIVLRYKDIVRRCDKVTIVTQETYEKNPKVMDIRNEYMVDKAELVLAVYDGSKGGTGNCVRYAKACEREIVYIDPKVANTEEVQKCYLSYLSRLGDSALQA